MCSLRVKGRSKSWEAHERDQRFGEYKSIEFGKSQRLQKEGNARINTVSAMKSGLVKIIETVFISWYLQSPEIDLHIAQNACCIDYADTWSLKRVHWLSRSQCSHLGTTDYEYKDTLELNTGIAWARLLITRIHTRVAPKSKIHWLPATFHNSRWMNHCEICHWSIEAISILDPVDFEEAYSHIALRYHSVEWHIQSHGPRDTSFG